jgi:hypothetical protein
MQQSEGPLEAARQGLQLNSRTERGRGYAAKNNGGESDDIILSGIANGFWR